jgi:flagellar hook-associated protein 2
MGIQMTGIASGLDTQSMIADLMKVERIKVERVENEKTISEWKKEEWGEVNTKLYSFYKEELFDFKSKSTYLQKSLASSNTSAVAVNNSPSSIQGAHQIEVTQLATAANITTDVIEKTNGEKATASTAINELFGIVAGDSRMLRFEDGTKSADIEIKDTDTIASLIDKIKSKDLDINISFDENHGRIFMSSKNTGAESHISVTEIDGKTDIMEALKFGSSLPRVANGINAEFSYNSVTLESESNEVSV